MALYMFMAKYSVASLRGILETGSDREAAARQAVEAVSGKLIGFYGMLGQEYGMALIVDVPGHAEYLAAVGPAIAAGVFESYKSIPLYTSADVSKAVPLAKKVAAVYQPPPTR